MIRHGLSYNGNRSLEGKLPTYRMKGKMMSFSRSSMIGDLWVILSCTQAMKRLFALSSHVSLFILLIIKAASAQPAQDGKLVDASPITLQPRNLERLEEIWPESKSSLGQVEIKAITYYS